MRLPSELTSCRLLAAVKEADPKLLPLLGRVWALGPKHTGPNLLLSSAGSSRAVLSSHGGRIGNLWDVPAAQVTVPRTIHLSLSSQSRSWWTSCHKQSAINLQYHSGVMHESALNSEHIQVCDQLLWDS